MYSLFVICDSEPAVSRSLEAGMFWKMNQFQRVVHCSLDKAARLTPLNKTLRVWAYVRQLSGSVEDLD